MGNTREFGFISTLGLQKCATKSSSGFIGQRFAVTINSGQGQNTLLNELDNVLNEYASIFEEVKGLPPIRRQDHQIPLKQGKNPPNIRPYRYP